MRWERLFADLAAELESTEAADLDSEVADRTRAEVGQVRLVDRLRVAQATVRLGCLGGIAVDGRVVEVGPDWVLVQAAVSGQVPGECLVALAHVVRVEGLGREAAAPGSEGVVVARLDLRHALRALVRDRAPVAVALLDGTSSTGTLDRVGADHVDLALHEPDEGRREAALRGVVALPVRSIVTVRRR